MAFRGGRGGFRFGFHKPDKQEPFILYPEDVALPDKKCVPLDKDFYTWNSKLQQYFENSPYFVEDSASQDNQQCDIETYSDSLKPRHRMKRGALSDYVMLKPGYFPAELVQGVKPRERKRTKWNHDKENENLDSLFAKLQKKNIGKKENKEDKEEDSEEEDNDEEKEEEYSSGGDYEQNEDFDDDEDDFNANDDGDDEPFY